MLRLPKVLLSTLPVVALAAFTMGSCGDDEGTSCDTDADCDLGEFCVSGTCSLTQADSCTDDTDCTDGQVCGAGGQCETPTGCTDNTDCDATQLCDVLNGVCIDQCTPVGGIGDEGGCSGVAEICIVDGTCEAQCDQFGTCVPAGELCQSDTLDPEFNRCEAADAVSGGCPRHTEWGESRDDDGPVITDVTVLGDINVDPDPNNPNADPCPIDPLPQMQMTVVSDDPVTASLFSQRLKRITTDGVESFVYSDGPNQDTHPSIEETSPGRFTVTFTLCRSDMNAATFAVLIIDEDGDQSNGFCFDVGGM